MYKKLENMRYFIDTEFLEGTQKEKFPISLFRKNTPNTIDLISIGIVSEDVYSETVKTYREYYAISKDFNLKEAWNRVQYISFGKDDKHKVKEYWIRENILKPIYRELKYKDDKNTSSTILINGKDYTEHTFNYSNLKKLITKFGKSNQQIAKEVKEFCDKGCKWNYPNKENEIQFYGYFSDYDWVVFCWLFGKMIDLPNGFPMLALDIKQELDRILNLKSNIQIGNYERIVRNGTFMIQETYSFDERINIIKHLPNYPKQTNEHSAIHDARWTKKLHEFLQEF